MREFLKLELDENHTILEDNKYKRIDFLILTTKGVSCPINEIPPVAII